jgi:hypothetical protein
MTVKVSKPAINVREELADLRKPTGLAGEAMLRAETPQEQQALIGVGRRNLLINGGFDVWQRATSVTGATSSGYSSADRWEHNSSGGTLSISRQALTVGQTSVPRSLRYFMRFNATTGNNNAGIWQKIEGVDRVQGEVTISFYAKGTNPSGGNFEIELEQYFGSGGSTYISSIETFSVTSEWQRFILTINVPSISGKTISGGNDYYRFYFRQPEGDTSTAAWTLDITGVQLELGKVATPFEHRSYGEELALCQRYYERIQDHDPQSQDTNGNTSSEVLIGLGMCLSSTRVLGRLDGWKVTKRVPPTVSISHSTQIEAIQTGAWYPATNTPNFRASIFGCRADFTHGGSLTAGGAVELRLKNDGIDAYIEIDAEL